MAGRTSLGRAEPGSSLTILDKLAPPPPADVVGDRIERLTNAGDVVLDLHARGGWIARAAIDRQRRAISIESGPLTRLLAELVLRPPDVRHLDAAFQALSASPRGETSLRLAIGELFAATCATCGRNLVADEVQWGPDPDGAAGDPVPLRKQYRCAVCRDQQGGGEVRHATLTDDDRRRATSAPQAKAVRQAIRNRFPIPDGADELVDDLLHLHSDRQLVGLAWILERIEADLRAEPIEAALRLAFLHAVLPASRLAGPGSRPLALRVTAGRVKPMPETWRERNPWLALEDGFRAVRAFVQRIEGGPYGPLQARFGEDIRSLGDGPTTAVVRMASPASLRALASESADLARRDLRPRVRLAIGQPPPRPTQERVALTFHGTAWALGRDAAAGLPVESLLGPSFRAPWGWQAAALRRSLTAVESLLDRDGRAVLLVEGGGAEPLVAAALGGAGAGFRLALARLGEPDEEGGGIVELVPPGASLPPGPRTRANVSLPPVRGGPGDPDLVSGRGLFAPPERVDARPFSAAEAARAVTDTAVEVLKARGEPARFERLLAEILVGLDRAGQLRRLASAGQAETPAKPASAAAPTTDHQQPDPSAAPAPAQQALEQEGVRAATAAHGIRGRVRADDGPPDQVERLLTLVRDEFAKPGQHRLVELEPDRWWLADHDDRLAAATPLADRVEWAVYSLLSTATSMSETAFLERIASLFSGYDLPDEALVRACLDSYRSRASTPDRLVTGEDLVRRSREHTELLALLADGGHRLGMQVWIGLREQSRKLDGRLLGSWLDDRERQAHLPIVARAPVEALEAVDAMWYVRSKAAFLFEVEWTAMLGDILRRHARIPQDERLVRFFVVPPERTELVRHKIDRSPIVREALEGGNWHVLKWNHLRTFLATDPLELGGIEPFLGLDPVAERTGEQLPLFESGRYA